MVIIKPDPKPTQLKAKGIDKIPEPSEAFSRWIRVSVSLQFIRTIQLFLGQN